MKSQIDEFLARVLSRWMDVVRVRARAVAVAVLLITVPIAAYTVLHLGINSDNVDLIGKNLPSKINHERFAALFPNLENALLVVIDAETPELAREAADALSAALREQTEQFTDVYLPGGGSFFERNGLLYRSVDELDQFAVEMANIQPIIGELERDPTVANLASLVRAGLTHANRGGEEGERWSAVLDRVGEATVEVYEEYPLAISWEELLVRGSSIEVITRRVIVVHPILDFERLLPAGRSLDAIERTVNELGYLPERGVRVRVTGNPAINYEEMIGLAWDIGGAGVFCFLLVALILFRALRSIRLVIAALATLLIGLIWTAGFATLAVGHLNLISIAFAILFIGLGVDFCIHLGMRYADLLRSTRDHAGSLRRAVDSVGSSLVVCALTTAIGFLVFIPTSYKGVAELGLISGGGMLIILVLTLTFFPALISSWLPVDPVRHLQKPLVFRTTWWRVFETHPGAVRWTALAAAVAAAVVVPNFRFDPNVVRMRDPSTPSVQAFDDLLADSRTSPWYTNAVAANLEEAQAMAARLRELDVVSRTVTLADYVPADQDEKLAILEDVAFLMDAPAGSAGPGDGAAARASAEGPPIEEQVGALRSLHDFLDAPWIEGDQSILAQSMRRLRAHLGQFLDRVERDENPGEALAALEEVLLATFPDQIARLRMSLRASEIELGDLPPELVLRMRATDGQIRVQIFPSESLESEAELVRFVDDVQSIVPDATGVAANVVAFGRAAMDAFQQALISALVVISILLWLMWRRVSEMVLALTPLLLGAALTVATMVLIDMPFNFANVVALPLLFGIGVDSGIHLVHRSQSVAGSGAALLETTTARAVFYSALTTAASFGSLAFSGHRGIASLGVLLVIGMVFTVLCNLIVLPALLDLRRRLSRRSASEPRPDAA